MVRLDGRVAVAVAVTTAVAAVLVGIAVLHTGNAGRAEAWQVVVGVMALLAADTALVDIRTGRDAESITFAEAMLAVALILLPWSYLLPLAGISVLAAHALRGRSLVKTVFNASSFVIGAAMATLIVGAAGVHGVQSVQPQDVATIALAMVTFFLWNGLATA